MRNDDFLNFVKTDHSLAPEELNNKIKSSIASKLKWEPTLLFTKLIFIHIIIGTLSLSICDQFGLDPFNTSFSLSNYFMHWGHTVCMVLCGALFLSFSIIFSTFFTNASEQYLLKKYVSIHMLGLTLISIFLFFILGAEVTLTLALLWSAGAIAGGMLSVKFINLQGRSYGSS